MMALDPSQIITLIPCNINPLKTTWSRDDIGSKLYHKHYLTLRHTNFLRPCDPKMTLDPSYTVTLYYLVTYNPLKTTRSRHDTRSKLYHKHYITLWHTNFLRPREPKVTLDPSYTTILYYHVTYNLFKTVWSHHYIQVKWYPYIPM